MTQMTDEWSRGYVTTFLQESLAIESIHRSATTQEIDATLDFLNGELTVDAVIRLQAVYAPGRPLRDQVGMNVRIGRYVPPPGSQRMREQLDHVLNRDDPWVCHVEFEKLHPFMDGNGRVGRAVWVWVMLLTKQDPFALSFLHRFYYQTLQQASAS